MSQRNTDELKRRAGRAIIAHAFFRLESALTICLTILLVFFWPHPWPWWPWWGWVALGLVAEGLIIYTSITDPRTGARVVAEMLRERYSPNAIKTPAYRQKVIQALEYRQGIEDIIRTTPPGILRDHLFDSTAGLADWIGHIYQIAQRLDAYERDELLHRDLKQMPASLAQLQKALAAETDPAVRQQIEATIQAKKAQYANLQALQNRMEQAQFRLEETLTSLGTVYSQFQLIRAQKLDSAGARSLSTGIREQVRSLQDLITSMDEVYGQKP